MRRRETPPSLYKEFPGLLRPFFFPLNVQRGLQTILLTPLLPSCRTSKRHGFWRPEKPRWPPGAQRLPGGQELHRGVSARSRAGAEPGAAETTWRGLRCRRRKGSRAPGPSVMGTVREEGSKMCFLLTCLIQPGFSLHCSVNVSL